MPTVELCVKNKYNSCLNFFNKIHTEFFYYGIKKEISKGERANPTCLLNKQGFIAKYK